jgi:y4mF family transcriptional regulator
MQNYCYNGNFMNAKKIGLLIRLHRKKSGLTQQQLATLGGVGKTAVFDIEKGKLTVRLSTLLKVLKVLNIQIEFQSKLMHLFQGQLNENG